MIHHYTPKNNFRYSLSLGVWSGHEIPQDHRIFCGWNIHMDVFPKMGKYPQITPIFMGCSIQNHPFHGTFQMFPQHPRVIYHVFLVKLRLSLADGGGAHILGVPHGKICGSETLGFHGKQCLYHKKYRKYVKKNYKLLQIEVWIRKTQWYERKIHNDRKIQESTWWNFLCQVALPAG